MAILTTPRGFHYPDSAQDPDVPRDIQALATDVDGQFVVVSTFTALPAFGKVGRQAYVADSRRIFLDTGTAWVAVGGPLDRPSAHVGSADFPITSTSPGAPHVINTVAITAPYSNAVYDVSFSAVAFIQNLTPGNISGVHFGFDLDSVNLYTGADDSFMVGFDPYTAAAGQNMSFNRSYSVTVPTAGSHNLHVTAWKDVDAVTALVRVHRTLKAVCYG
jgi:hypothetical protein